ncbi:MAG: hypothetical protein LBI74_06205 [Synergistaceae bacterium]|nr:hypothetical protein [Synergistaceae bacterium]
MEPSIDWKEPPETREKFLVVGAGESGSGFLERIKKDTVESVEFFAARDLGEVTQARLGDADMLFVIANMEEEGDADIASAAAKRAKKMGRLTVGVVEMPDSGSSTARENAAKISESVDALFTVASGETQGEDIGQIIFGIVDLANSAGRSIIAVDFADVRAALEDAKTAIFTVGAAEGENRAAEAAEAALKRVMLPLEAKAQRLILLFRIHGESRVTELQEAALIIRDRLGCENSALIFGHIIDDKAGDSMRISILAAEFIPDISLSSTCFFPLQHSGQTRQTP